MSDVHDTWVDRIRRTVGSHANALLRSSEEAKTGLSDGEPACSRDSVTRECLTWDNEGLRYSLSWDFTDGYDAMIAGSGHCFEDQLRTIL